MESSLRLNDSHSLYLLGQKASAPIFKRYALLMQACAQQGEFLSFETTPEWLSCYEKDSQILQSKLPLLVFRPTTIASIAPFIQACYELDLAMTMRCGGTGLAGSCVPSTESVVLLTGHLKHMHDYDAEKGIIHVEPGVTVRQLNQYVATDQWRFPLSMVTEGVAGLAGCLSCHARGYHQQQQTLVDAIQQVTLVDGQGQIVEVPAAWVCGAEGLGGVIINMQLKLKRRPSQSQLIVFEAAWQHVLEQLSDWLSLYALVSVVWTQNKFYFMLEGESWRVTAAADYLFRHLHETNRSFSSEQAIPFLIPSRKTFVMISSVFYSSQLPEACQWSLAQAEQLQLECLQQADVLAGSLHLILQSQEDAYSFAQKVEQFLILWTDFIDRHQGALASCHGVGLQMRPYMTPFWTEETQQLWRRLQASFDPKKLFSKEHFFPFPGKSLEKVRQA